jgi:hypothetical protein
MPLCAALPFVKRGTAATPAAIPVLNIHILLFHTPHPQAEQRFGAIRPLFRFSGIFLRPVTKRFT